jgi:hypothetical protein
VDECILFFEFDYNNSVNPSTGHSPFILSYAHIQLASPLGLDTINNVREARDALHGMTNEFRVRNVHLAKPHSYKVGGAILLSTKNVQLNLQWKIWSRSSLVLRDILVDGEDAIG